MTTIWPRWVGRISYGAYIFHDMYEGWFVNLFRLLFPVFALAHNFLMKAAASAVALPFTLLLAWLSCRFLESRFLNLKERLSR